MRPYIIYIIGFSEIAIATARLLFSVLTRQGLFAMLPVLSASIFTGPPQRLCLLSLILLSSVQVVFLVAVPPVLAPKFKPSATVFYALNHLAPEKPALGVVVGGVILTTTSCQDSNST